MLRRPKTDDFKGAPVRLKRSVRTLLTPEQMNTAILRESGRVDRRGGGALALVLFRFDGIDDTRSLTYVRLAKTILRRIRITDDVGWFDELHLAVLLPDTPAAGAWRLAQHVCDRVTRRGPRPVCTMYSYPAAPAAESRPDGVLRTVEEPTPLRSEKLAS